MNKKCSLLKKEQQKQVEKRIQNILFFHQMSLHEFQMHCLEKAFEKQQMIKKMKNFGYVQIVYIFVIIFNKKSIFQQLKEIYIISVSNHMLKSLLKTYFLSH